MLIAKKGFKGMCSGPKPMDYHFAPCKLVSQHCTKFFEQVCHSECGRRPIYSIRVMEND